MPVRGRKVSGGGSGETISIAVAQTAHGFSVFDAIYFDGTDWQKAQADNILTLGTNVVSAVADVDNFTRTLLGKITGLTVSSGETYYVSDATPGLLTTTESAIYSNPLFVATSATEGDVLSFSYCAQSKLVHGISIDNGVEPIIAGFKGYFIMPYDCTIVSWSLIGDTTGSVVFDIWAKTGAVPTATDTITAAAKPTLTSELYATSSALTGWTVNLNGGDIIAYNVDSTDTFTQLQLILNVTTR